MSVKRGAHDPSARYAGTSPSRTPRRGGTLKPETTQPRMVVGPPAEPPVVLAVGFGDGMFVDAGNAPLHQPVGVELPVLVAVGSEPEAVIVVILIGEAHGDAVAGAGPQ